MGRRDGRHRCSIAPRLFGERHLPYGYIDVGVSKVTQFEIVVMVTHGRPKDYLVPFENQLRVLLIMSSTFSTLNLV